MATVANLAVALTARVGQFESAMKGANQTIKGLQSQISRLEKAGAANTAKITRGFEDMKRTMGGVRTKIIGLVGALGAMRALKAGLDFSMELERSKIAFTTMTGSATVAEQTLNNLKAFSATTPFQFPDIVAASKKLMAFGVSAGALQNRLQMLGDISAGANVPIGDLANIFGKIKAKGKAMTEEIMQMAERGIPIVQVLAEKFGVSTEEILKMAEQGQLSFDVIDSALNSMTASGGIFEGMMVNMSETTSGKLSTLKDNFLLLAGAIGDKLRPHIETLIDKTMELIEFVKNLDQKTIDIAVSVVKWTAAIVASFVIIKKVMGFIRGLIQIYKALTAAQIIQQALSGPMGWATLAAGAAIATGAIIGMNAAFDGSVGSAENSADAITKKTDAIEKNNDAVFEAIKKQKALEEAEKAEKKRIEDLQRKADQVAQAVRTPVEVFRDKVAELQELLNAGVLSWSNYQRAIAKATDTLKSQRAQQNKQDRTERKSFGAVTRGSVAAFSAGKKSDDHFRKMAENQKRQIKEQQETNRLLATLDVARPPTPVNL